MDTPKQELSTWEKAQTNRFRTALKTASTAGPTVDVIRIAHIAGFTSLRDGGVSTVGKTKLATTSTTGAEVTRATGKNWSVFLSVGIAQFAAVDFRAEEQNRQI